MGDENTVLSDAEARHLLRRTGFGVKSRDLDKILKENETRGQAVDRLLDYRPSRFRPTGRYIEDSHNRYIRYLLRTRTKVPPSVTELARAGGGIVRLLE